MTPATPVDIHSLIRPNASVEEVLYVNMDGSKEGQIVIQSWVEAPACADYGDDARIQYVEVFDYEPSSRAWLPIADSSTWPSPESPLVPLSTTGSFPEIPESGTPNAFVSGCWAILHVTTQVAKLKPDGVDVVVITVLPSSGVGTPGASVFILEMDSGQLNVLFETSATGDVTAFPDGASLVLDKRLYNPVDGLCCPSGREKVRLSWDGATQKVVQVERTLFPNCTEGGVEVLPDYARPRPGPLADVPAVIAVICDRQQVAGGGVYEKETTYVVLEQAVLRDEQGIEVTQVTTGDRVRVDEYHEDPDLGLVADKVTVLS